MKRKIFMLLTLFLLTIQMCGCDKQKNENKLENGNTGSGSSSQIIDESVYSEKIPTDIETIITNIEVNAVQSTNDKYVIFIKNNNDFVIPDLDVTLNFYKNGLIIDLCSDGHDAILPEHTIVSECSNIPKDFDEVKAEIDVSWLYGNSYRNHTDDLIVNSNIGEDGVVVQITNNSEVEIEEIEYIVVCYKENNIVDVSYPKDITNVRIGKTITEKVNFYKLDFDRFEVYINQAHTF